MPTGCFFTRQERLYVRSGDAGVSAHVRDKPLMLAVAAVNFTHKVAAAAVFGVWGCGLRSWKQLVLLTCFQVGGCSAIYFCHFVC